MPAMDATDLARTIREAIDLLRGRMDPSACSDVVSALLLLKWASDQPGQLEIPERARWTNVACEDECSREGLNKALRALLDSNRNTLGDLFSDLDFVRRLNGSEAQRLIGLFNKISLKTDHLKFEDVVGKAYDQILAAFADAAGKRGGEFFTPRSVIQLMVRLARPKPGQSVCDPFAGSAGMLTCAEEYVTERAGQHGELDLFAQEVNAATCGIARLNLLFHGALHASVLCGNTLTSPLHSTDDGRLSRFDRVLTNPPFSMGYRSMDVSFPERMRYGWPPRSGRNADWIIIQHVLATLAPDGVGVMVTPHGVLFRGGAEADIRREILLNGRLEAVIGIGANVFHGTSIPACILVLRGDGRGSEAKNEVLFINAEHEITTGRSRNRLAPRHVEKIVAAFRRRREIPHFSRVVGMEEIASNDFNLNIRRYVDVAPSATLRLDTQALLFGGVPRADVEAQRDRFQAFDIDIATLFASADTRHLKFPPAGWETIAEKIPDWAATSEDKFLRHLHDWWESETLSLLNPSPRALPATRRYLMESFRKQLLPLAILNEHQLVGVFADWWAGHHDDLRELSRASLDQNADSPDVTDMKLRETTLDMLEEDLSARVKYLVILARQELVDIYRSWGDQYGTSLQDLEKRRETSATQLTSRLRNLGYPWPDGA